MSADQATTDGWIIDSEGSPCPWCRRLVEPVMQGGHLKEFCSKRHKNLYNAALNKLSIAYARTIRTPGSLRTWAAARVNPSPGGAEDVSRTSEGPEYQSDSSAPPRDEVQ